VLLRRRRAGQEDVLPPPELGQPVDYTSLPYEEPTSLGDRLRQAPIGVKLLLALVPIVVIVAGVVLWLTFFNNPGGGTATNPTSPPAPPTITNVVATLAGPSRIVVEADTNLPDNATVTAAMKEGERDFPWFNRDAVNSEVGGGRVRVVLEKARSAPTPKSGQEQTISLIATVDNQVITSDPAKLSIPSIYRADFFREAAAAPTAAPTAAQTAVPPTPAEPTAVPPTPAEPTALPTATLTATVFNGGNIRPQPKIETCTCPQIHAGEVVTLLERSNDGKWYRVKAPEAEGWVSATLLTVDPEVAKQVPASKPSATGLTAKVFNGGNVRQRPVTGKPLDQINAGETVQLLAKTSDGGWYQITDIRGVTGWVSVTLLTIDPAVAKQVPVAK
jgi:SH3-like domain-containing protein